MASYVQPSATYYKNKRITTKCTFSDGTGALYAPTGPVLCTVSTPAGAATTYTQGVTAGFTNPSTGIYQLNLTLNESGTWYIKFDGQDGNVIEDAVRALGSVF